MRSMFGNNCAKGCLIYIVALVVLLVVAAMGLDGLRARFGGAQVQGNRPAEYTIQSTNPSAPAATSPQQPAPAATTAGNAPAPTTPPAVPPPVTGEAPSGMGAPAPAAPAPPAQAQAQNGTIKGETGGSFYVVEPGDTLWAITDNFGVSLDDLRSLNSLADDIIYPGQALYLPDAQAPAQVPTMAPVPPDTGMPSMPNTGIVNTP